jgi:hypothetical protein
VFKSSPEEKGIETGVQTPCLLTLKFNISPEEKRIETLVDAEIDCGPGSKAALKKVLRQSVGMLFVIPGGAKVA